MSNSKEQNRKDMPEIAKFADEWRAIFGDGIWVRYAIENGKELGKKDVREFFPTTNTGIDFCYTA